VSISPLEPSSRTLYWYSRHSYLQFQIACFTFLLVFFNSLAGKAFLARSIELCLVDKQRSSGVTVAGFESCLIWSRIANIEISTNWTYRLPLGRSGLYASLLLAMNVLVFWPLHLWWSKTLRFKTHLCFFIGTQADTLPRKDKSFSFLSRAPYILQTTDFSSNNACNNCSDVALTGRRHQELKPHFSEKVKMSFVTSEYMVLRD
jgi:hypothetical protein